MNTLRNIFLIGLAYLLPVISVAQSTGSGSNTGGSSGSGSNTVITLDNPLKGFGTLQGFVEAVLNNIVLPVGSVVVVIFIIYSGFLFVTAQGNESKLEEAKHSLLTVVIGAAILLGALAISSAINGTLCQLVKNLPNCPRPQNSQPINNTI